MQTFTLAIDWLNASAAWATALAAIVYTFFTIILVNETRRQRRAFTDPCVIVYAKQDIFSKSIIMLVVENVGKSPAFNVKFTADRAIPCRAYGIEGPRPEQFTMADGPLVNGIPGLPPGGTREFSWGQFGGLNAALGNNPLRIKATYEHENRKLSTDSIVDIKSFGGTDASERDPAHSIDRHLKEIANEVKNWSKSSNAVRVQLVDLKKEQ